MIVVFVVFESCTYGEECGHRFICSIKGIAKSARCVELLNGSKKPYCYESGIRYDLASLAGT